MRRTKDASGDAHSARVDGMISKADELYRQHDFEDAMKIYGAAVKAGARGRAPAMFILLTAIMEEPEKALRIADKTISEDPNNGAAYASRASALMMENMFPEAIAEYKVALEKEPGHKEMYADIGYTLSSLGRHKESVKAYRKSIAMLPDDLESVYSMCRELEILGRYHEALNLLKKYKGLESIDRRIYMHMGRVYGKLGDWKQAYQSHVKAIWMPPPEKGESNYNRMMKRYAKIMNISKLAREAEPNADSLFWLAVQLFSIKWDENAVSILDTVTRRKPSYVAYMAMGETYARHMQLHLAIKHYTRALKFADKNELIDFEIAFTYLARCTFQCGLFRDSLNYCRKAKHLGINNEEIDEYCSVILENYGEDPEDQDQMAAGWTTPETF